VVNSSSDSSLCVSWYLTYRELSPTIAPDDEKSPLLKKRELVGGLRLSRILALPNSKKIADMVQSDLFVDQILFQDDPINASLERIDL